jgi:hypothetical protein
MSRKHVETNPPKSARGAAYLSWALRIGEVQYLLLPFKVSRERSPVSYWVSVGVMVSLILFCCWSAVNLWRGELQP